MDFCFLFSMGAAWVCDSMSTLFFAPFALRQFWISIKFVSMVFVVVAFVDVVVGVCVVVVVVVVMRFNWHFHSYPIQTVFALFLLLLLLSSRLKDTNSIYFFFTICCCCSLYMNPLYQWKLYVYIFYTCYVKIIQIQIQFCISIAFSTHVQTLKKFSFSSSFSFSWAYLFQIASNSMVISSTQIANLFRYCLFHFFPSIDIKKIIYSRRGKCGSNGGYIQEIQLKIFGENIRRIFGDNIRWIFGGGKLTEHFWPGGLFPPIKIWHFFGQKMADLVWIHCAFQ